MHTRAGGHALIVMCALAANAVAQPPEVGAKEAKRSSGYIHPEIRGVKDDRLNLAMRVETIGYWEVWSLVGEPVEFCILAWRIPPQPAVLVKVGDKMLKVPDDVLQQVRLNEAELTVEIRSAVGSGMTFSCDAGAIVAAAQLDNKTWSKVKAWSDAERMKYFSFNTPGSPAWSELFEGTGADKAKQIVKAGFSGTVPRRQTGISKAGFDLSAVHAWIASQEAEQAEEKREAIKRAAAKRAEAQKLLDKASAEDFWSAHEESETVAQRDKRVAAEKAVEEAEQRANELANQARQRAAEAAQQRERKLAEVKNRPSPGNGREIAAAESTIVKLLDGFAISRSKALFSCYYDDERREIFTARRTGACRVALSFTKSYVRRPDGRPNCTVRSEKHYFSRAEVEVDFQKNPPRLDGALLRWSTGAVTVTEDRWPTPKTSDVFYFGLLPDASLNALEPAFQTLIDKCPTMRSGGTP